MKNANQYIINNLSHYDESLRSYMLKIYKKYEIIFICLILINALLLLSYFISIFFEAPVFTLGILTSKTPFLNFASILLESVLLGNVKDL